MGFSISVDDHEAIAAIAKLIADAIVTHWAASTNPPIRVVDEPLADVIEVGGLVIDTKAYDVTDDGVPIHLKPREYALLLALARGAGHAFTREQLLELAWPLDATIITDDRTVDVHIRRLRVKLGSSASRIETINSVGYRLRRR
ncbi:MAG: hypothetical protein NVSMB64_27670 [Candidatus Velthaea sp.]